MGWADDGAPAAGRLLEHVCGPHALPPEAAVDGTYEIRFVDGEVISLDVRDGELTAMRGEAREPRLVIEAEPASFHALIEGREPLEAVLAGGGVRLLTGTEAELAALAKMFAPDEARAAAAA